MSDQPLHDFARAVDDLKATVWAAVEPPLARLTGWINRLTGGYTGMPSNGRKGTMPQATKSDRWTMNQDGSWTRSIDGLPGEVAGVTATATAKEAADQLGIDLSTVEGTGKDGRITKQDVEQAAS